MIFKTLIALEVLTLAGAIRNIGVRGSLSRFIWSELAYVIVAFCLGALSIGIEERRIINERGPSSLPLMSLVQTKIFLYGVALVGVVITIFVAMGLLMAGKL
jgi:hypothetical protein